MFSILEDQLMDDAVSRAEQSRVSYNIQTEEFRNLNADLQTYLGDIKTIDDNNRQLQENIEQIRADYISTLENHLKRLPNDFRQQSQKLTEGHIERYRIKSRTRRIINEREEVKRRINFLASNEKEQTKRLNLLQKQERLLRNEFSKLNEQVQRLLSYVESEKQTHRQAMDKVDSLQGELERVYVERSKTEFEIQTLKEEVKLMQTAKEFLDEERETIIATQTDANEYLLSRLSESISRIREDFDSLNNAQLKQFENEYKQMLQKVEENLMANEPIDETTTTHQRAIQIENERLQDEQQSVLRELTTLDDHNKSLSERVLAMEADLYSLRDERMQQLQSKDSELQRSKIELQTLNEKLNNLAEYDRNLKFELTLYRGVLESEYRRKQQQKQSPISTSYVVRPTTLRSNNNSMTDKSIWLTSNTNQSKFNDQQQEEILTTRDRVQSDYDPLGEDAIVQIDDVVSTKTPSNDESLSKLLIGSPKGEQQRDKISTNIISQDTEKSSSSLLNTAPTEEQSTLPFEAQQSSSRTSTTSAGTRKSSTSSIPPILQENQSPISDVQRSPTTPLELRSLSATSSSNQAALPASTDSESSKVLQSPSASTKEDQTLREVSQSSSRTSSIGSAIPSDIQKSSTSAATPIVSEYQSPTTPPQEHVPSSRTSSVGAKTPSDVQKTPISPITSTVPEFQTQTSTVRQMPSTPPQENQTSSRTSSISPRTSTDIQKSPSSATTRNALEYQPPIFDVHQSPSTPPQESQPSSRTPSISSKTPSETPKPPTSPITSTVPAYQSQISEVRQSPSTPPQESQPSSRTSSISAKTPSETQEPPTSPITSTVPAYQSQTSEVRQSPSTPPQESQPSSGTLSISSKTPSETPKSPILPITSTVPVYQSQTSEVHQSPSTPSQESQPSSRTSSISSKTPSETPKPPISPITSTVPAYQSQTSEVRQSPSTSPQESQPSSGTSSISSKTPSEIPKPPISPITSTVPAYQSQTSEVRQSPSTPPQESQPSSRTSSISSKTPSETPKPPISPITSTVPEYQSQTSEVRQSPSTPSEGRQTLSEVQKSPTTNIPSTSTDVQEKASPIVADDSQTTTSRGILGDENQLTRSASQTDDNIKHEEKPLHGTDEKTTKGIDHPERQRSIHTAEPFSSEELEISVETKPNELQSSSVALTTSDTSQEERKQSLSQSDNILHPTNVREEINSSLTNKTEENSPTGTVSSSTTHDNKANLLSGQDTTKQLSHSTSLTDIKEVDSPTSRKSEPKSDDDYDDDDTKLAATTQDLRYVFHDLANNEDLVEINNDLPNKLLDRLEFRDYLRRTLFESLVKKYLVQAAAQSHRSKTLDWIEFHDILFPIITGRYNEQHIRKLFDLFDTSGDGYLPIQEIADLLELLQANDALDLAQNMIDKCDTSHDGKISVDELIEAIKKIDDMNEHALPEETENQTISIEVPIINFPSKLNDKFNKEISLLGRIFKKLGANSDSKQLDSNNKNLSMQITTEFVNNNVKISNDDLQSFIQLFLNKKQKTDPIISWIEFRDTFLPIINNGFYFNNDIKRWFQIFNTNHNEVITREQVIQLLRLLQIQNPDGILKKLTETIKISTDNTASWTLDELIFALDNVDETAAHHLANNEPIASFDTNWLSNNIL